MIRFDHVGGINDYDINGILMNKRIKENNAIFRSIKRLLILHDMY